MSIEAQSRPPEIFSARVAIIMFLVGVFSFSAFVTLSTFAPEYTDGNDGEAHALSKSAIGYSGIVKLQRASGTGVTVARAIPAAGAPKAPLVVLTPETTLKFETIDRMASDNVLVVIPKWFVIPSRERKGWVRESSPLGGVYAKEILEEIAPQARVEHGTATAAPTLKVSAKHVPGDAPAVIRPGKIDQLQSLSGAELTPVATTQDGKVVLALLKGTRTPAVYILADPDLLNNHGIADKATARAATEVLGMLRAKGAAITFDVTLNGLERTRSIMRLAFEPPLLAATLSFVIVAGMLAWRAATRSGPTARKGRAIALGKRTLADNSAALIRLAGRTHKMAPRYADMVRSVVASHIKLARDASETTAAELDRIAESRKVANTYSELAAEAANAETAHATLASARKLHAWTGDMIRATR
jgi:hypothetical protein